MKREYTINLLAGRNDSTEPCQGCKHVYRCDGDRMACSNFKFFVETGRPSNTLSKWPSHEIYIEIFHTEPKMAQRGTV